MKPDDVLKSLREMDNSKDQWYSQPETDCIMALQSSG
jgi:hypothetical protein